MKNKSFTLLALAAIGMLIATTFYACKKEPGTTNTVDNRTRTEILTTGKWYIASYKDQTAGVTVELVDLSKPCVKDDASWFTAASGTATSGDVYHANPVPCGGPGEPVDGKKDGWGWKFSSDGKYWYYTALAFGIRRWTKDEIFLYRASEDNINGDSTREWIIFKPVK